MEKIIIKIAGLSDGEFHFEFNEPVTKLDLDAPFCGKFTVKVKLQKMVHQFFVDFSLSADAEFECDRCAVLFQTKLKNNFKMVYSLGGAKTEGSEDTLDFACLPADCDKINIAQELREFAMLSVPMKKLCKDDCKGLCPRCGKDLNESLCGCENDTIDERWLPLNKLKNILNN